MTERALTGFVKVVELGSFTAAADALFISQSALSQQIRTLENQLHFTLFQHGSRQVTLTAAGRSFYPQGQADPAPVRERRQGGHRHRAEHSPAPPAPVFGLPGHRPVHLLLRAVCHDPRAVRRVFAPWSSTAPTAPTSGAPWTAAKQICPSRWSAPASPPGACSSPPILSLPELCFPLQRPRQPAPADPLPGRGTGLPVDLRLPLQRDPL